MSIRKRVSKKTKSGFTYQVYFPYVDASGVTQMYRKGGFLTKKAAEEFEAQKKAEIVNFGCLYIDSSKTFDEMFQEYMKVNENSYARATKQYYQYTYEVHVYPALGRRKLLSLHYKDLQEFLNAPEHTWQTAINLKKILDVTFKYACKQGIIRENPMMYVTLTVPKSHKDKPKTISLEDMETFISHLLKTNINAPDKEDVNYRNKSIRIALYIGYYTGARLSEAVALKKSDIDFENNTVDFNKRVDYHGLKASEIVITEKMKTQKSKAKLPLAEPLKEVLQEWFETHPYEYICTDIYGNIISPETLGSRLQNVSNACGIKLHFHMLRHSFATNIALNGIAPEVARDLARHSSVRTTLDVYTHVQEEQKQSALAKVFGETKAKSLEESQLPNKEGGRDNG